MGRDRSADTFERVLALKSFPILAGLQPEDLTSLARRLAPRACQPGQEIVAPGKPPELQLVLAGTVLERHGSQSQRSVTAGGVVAGLAALSGEVGSVAARAETPTRLLTLPRTDLLDILEDHFDIWLVALGSVARAGLRARRLARAGTGADPAESELPGVGSLRALADRIAVLRSMPLFGRLPVHAVGRIAADARVVDLPAGTRLWSRDDPAPDVWILVRGALCGDPNAEHPGRVPGGGLLGLEEALGDGVRAADVSTRTRIRALRISREALLDELEDDPATANDLLTALAGRVQSRLDSAATRASGSAGGLSETQ